MGRLLGGIYGPNWYGRTMRTLDNMDFMINRRVLYWSGPIGVLWIWALEGMDHWLRQKWQSRVLEASATGNVWLGIVAIYIVVLALAALTTHGILFLKRPAQKRPFATAWYLLPQLLLCGIVIGTSIVLGSPGVFDRLREFGLAFLSRFLFYVAVVWSLMTVLASLVPPASPAGNETRPGDDLPLPFKP